MGEEPEDTDPETFAEWVKVQEEWMKGPQHLGVDLEFGLLVDIIYHRRRANWFELAHALVLGAAMIAVSAAAADIFPVKACALVASALIWLDLVFGLTPRAVAHRDRARQLDAVLAALHLTEYSEEGCRVAARERSRSAARDPANHRAVRDIGFNEAVLTLGRDESSLVRISLPRRLLAHWLWFDGG